MSLSYLPDCSHWLMVSSHDANCCSRLLILASTLLYTSLFSILLGEDKSTEGDGGEKNERTKEKKRGGGRGTSVCSLTLT